MSTVNFINFLELGGDDENAESTAADRRPCTSDTCSTQVLNTGTDKTELATDGPVKVE